MREPEIALVFSPEAWVEELHRHFADHGGARVRQVLVDPALALDDDYDTLVVSHRWPALTRALVADLHDRRRRILGVYDREEPAAREILDRLGVDAVVESDAGPRAFLESLLLLTREPDDAPIVAPGEPTSVSSADATSAGRTILVGGPAGAGKTEIAIELARALAGREGATALLDADEVAPSVAARLSTPIEPNLRSAIDAVEFGLGTLSGSLRSVPHAGFTLVAGLPNVAAWSQVRPGEVARVLRGLAGSFEAVVVDVAAPLDDVGAGSRGRYALARALLQEADEVVAVGGADPVGVTRLLAWLASAHSIAPDAQMHVVVNRAPRDRFRRGEVYDEIYRTFPPASLSFTPFDRRVEAAAWAGSVVRRGPFTRAVGAASAGGGALSGRPDAYDTIRRDSLGRIERRRLRIESDLDEMRSEVDRAVDDYQRRAHLGEEIPLGEPREMAERVLRSINDLGPLTDLVARRDVEEIFIEGSHVSFLDTEGRVRGLAVPTTEDENRQIIDRLLASTDRQLNVKNPIVQARVLQGARG